MIRAVIFDCFGVVIGDALSAMKTDLDTTDPQAVARIRSLLDQANTGQITADQSSKQIAEIFGMAYGDYRSELATHEVKDVELLRYIADLRKHYKTAMLSNIPKHSLSRRFTDEELAHYFDVVVASGEIGYAKPEARAYEIVAERLGVRLEECVFTDDRMPYCDGAQMVGMHTILYESFEQFRTQLDRLLADSQ